MFKIEVPVHPHIEKFIRSHIKADPIPVNTKGFIGIHLFLLLDKNINHHPEGFRKPAGVLNFAITEFLWEYSGAELSPVKIHLFNDLLDGIFNEKLFCAIDISQATYPERRKVVRKKVSGKQLYYQKEWTRRTEVIMKKPDIKDVIFEFMRAHGINESDISYDTLKKRYYRFRKYREHNGTNTSKIFS